MLDVTGIFSEWTLIPFLEQDGQYWGKPPDSTAAINELERLRAKGADFIIFAWPAFWWLEHYAGFGNHLRSNFDCVLDNEHLLVFDLRPCAEPSATSPRGAS